MRKELEKLSPTHAEGKVGLASELGDVREDFERREEELDALGARPEELENGLGTLRKAPKKNEKKFRGSSRKWFRMSKFLLMLQLF